MVVPAGHLVKFATSHEQDDGNTARPRRSDSNRRLSNTNRHLGSNPPAPYSENAVARPRSLSASGPAALVSRQLQSPHDIGFRVLVNQIPFILFGVPNKPVFSMEESGKMRDSICYPGQGFGSVGVVNSGNAHFAIAPGASCEACIRTRTGRLKRSWIA